MLDDVGLEPRHRRRAATALVDEVVPTPGTNSARDLGRGEGQLIDVGGSSRPRRRDGVRGEDESGAAALGRVELIEGSAQAIRHGPDEAGMVPIGAYLVDGHPGQRQGLEARVEILAVLPAAAVGTESRCHDREEPTVTVFGHGRDRVGQQGMPVAVPEVHGQGDPGLVESVLQGPHERPILFVYGADTAEAGILPGHLGEPLDRYVPPPGHVLQERHHVVGPLGASEGEQQESVVAAHDSAVWQEGQNQVLLPATSTITMFSPQRRQSSPLRL